MSRFSLTQSTSGLDRWRDRAIRIARWEFFLALGLAIGEWSYFPKPSQFEYNHPLMTDTKLAVAISTIFLPLASCFAAGISKRRQIRRENTLIGEPPFPRARLKPLIYSSFQILQLIACSWVAAYDFVIFSARRPWFYISLVVGLMPALAGTILGLVGIARFMFAGSAQLALHRYRSSTAGEEFSDEPIEHCALELAYQQQLLNDPTEPELAGAGPSDGCLANGDGILQSQLSHEETNCTRARNNQHPENNATTQKPDTSQTPIRDDQIRSRHPISPRTRPRFRWQEQTGVRHGGRAFWTPHLATIPLLIIWGLYYRWVINNRYLSLQLLRLYALEAVAPVTISALSHAALTYSLRRPLLLLIFTAFCFSVLASAIWSAEFLYNVWFFFRYVRQMSAGFNLMHFVLILVSFAMTGCHLALLRCSVMMEWTPGYSSLFREYKLWKERWGEPGADTEGNEDEEI